MACWRVWVAVCGRSPRMGGRSCFAPIAARRCWHSVAGYSKINSYVGSGSSKSITTGFQPSFLIIKRTDSADSWQIYDDQRGVTNQLEANTANAEYTQDGTSLVSFNSNGFTLGADNSGRVNTNGGNYIYLAIK